MRVIEKEVRNDKHFQIELFKYKLKNFDNSLFNTLNKTK